MKLKDKIAIAGGGARGIGEAIVRAYAAEGGHVAVAGVETAPDAEYRRRRLDELKRKSGDVRSCISIASI